MGYSDNKTISLPQPKLKGTKSVEEVLYRRKSIRDYKSKSIPLADVGQLLWAAQGKAASDNRTAPSAGATYPMELYVIAGAVQGLKPGVYHYVIPTHALELIQEGDIRNKLEDACLGQPMVSDAPVSILIDAIPERTVRRYHVRGESYIYMEAGHIGENIYLQATALEYGTVAIGAFQDEEVKRIIPALSMPLYIFPVGKPK